MIDYKYRKYKKKYLELKGGNKKLLNIVLLHTPTIFTSNEEMLKDSNTIKIVSQLNNYGTVHNYFFKFGYYKNKYILDDYKFKNAARDIRNKYDKLDRILLVCMEHASPYGLYYADKYSERCVGVICYPLRYYSKKSLERRIWKYKDQGGWKKYIGPNYDINDYYLNINDERLKKLLKNPKDEERQVLYQIFDIYLMKQYKEIPKIFRIPTYLFTRLDMDMDSIIKLNYERKDIAEMKGIVSEENALYNSMMWNFVRIKYDRELIEGNEDNLRIQYIIGGIQDIRVIGESVRTVIYMSREGWNWQEYSSKKVCDR